MLWPKAACCLCVTLFISLVHCLKMNRDRVNGSSLERSSSRERSSTPSSRKELSSANADQVFRLFKEATAATDEPNIVLSPLSIASVFGILVDAAEGCTATEILTAFGFSDSADFCVPSSSNEDEEGGVVLLNANRLYVSDTYKLLEDFKRKAEEKHGASIKEVDFRASEEVADEINSWVSEKTKGHVENIIPRGMLSPASSSVIINAIYFQGKWLHPFEAEKTKRDDFWINDHQKVSVDFMHQTEMFGYHLDQKTDLQVVRLPYASKDRSSIAMYIIASATSGGAVRSSLWNISPGEISELTGYAKKNHHELRLAMPKFSFETELGLVRLLQKMGIQSAFSSSADFSKMAEYSYGLYVESAFHKAKIKVDEEGTVAAAATAIVMCRACAPRRKIEVKLNQPFMFVITDEQSRQTLFIGKVGNPSLLQQQTLGRQFSV